MKTVFMLVNYTPGDLSIGITKKISAQKDALRRLGYGVWYSAYEPNGIAIYNAADERVFFEKYRIPKENKLHGFFRYQDLLITVLRYLKASGQTFDFCFARISAMNFRYLRVLRMLKEQGSKILVEALAYFPGIKMKTVKGKYVVFCLQKNKKKICQYVDKMITEGNVDDFFGIKTESVKIGVDINKLQEHKYIGDRDALQLISVASEQEYHAYDRLIKSLYEYKANGGQHSIKIHLVGELYPKTRQMIQDLQLTDYVVAHGKVFGDALFALYNACNMGVGPLGQHRVGGKKDTGLKTKEYFGIGLPYFYAGEEAEVPNGYPYTYQVPSDESMIDFDALWKFYSHYRDQETVAQEMRSFAKETYSWDAIMQKVMTV